MRLGNFSLWMALSLSGANPALAQAQVTAPAPPVASKPADTAPPARIPLENFARLPFVDTARLSPDGTRIAGLFGVKGKQVISIVGLYDRTDMRVLPLPEDTEAAWVRWVNDDNILVGLYALQLVPGGDRWTISRVVAINRSTGAVTKLLWDLYGQNASDVVWIPSDGSNEILLAGQNSIYLSDEFWPTVYRVNVVTGKRKTVLKGRQNVMNWQADASGNIRSGIEMTNEGRNHQFLYRSAGETGSFRRIDKASTRKREALIHPFLFLPGTDHALTLHDDEQGRSAIYEIDLTTQADVRTVFAAPKGSEVEGVILSRDGTALLGAYVSGVNKIAWLDPDLANIQESLDKSVPTRNASITSFSSDRSRLLVMVDRPDSPGALYYFDTPTGKMNRVALINDALGTRSLAPVRMIRYAARDGLEIEAVLTVPSGRAEAKLPIIMLPHGGPWGQDGLNYDYWAQFLASLGYAVLQPNFRGSTGYGTDFLRAGEGQMGLAMQDDISDGLAWAVKQGIADPARACIMGASYGGYAAMWGVAKDPDLYRCSISIAGVANLRREVNDFGDMVSGGKFKDDWTRMTPDFAAVSPIKAVDRIKVPMLLIHGKKDITVHVGQSSAMFDKMRSASKVVEYLPLPEADHYFTRQEDRLALLSAVERFLARHNPPDPAAGAAPAAK